MKQYPLDQFLFDTRIPYAQGRIIYCVEQYVMPDKGEALIDEALAITNMLKTMSHGPDDVGMVPDDPEVEWLSRCTERYIEGRAMNRPEIYVIRAAANLHLFPSPALAVLDNMEKNLRVIKASIPH